MEPTGRGDAGSEPSHGPTGPQPSGPSVGSEQVGHPRAPTNNAAYASLGLGILSIVVFPAGVFVGPLAIAFGAIGLVKATRGAPLRWMALSGLGLAILGTTLGLLGLILDADL
jgi:hypothetical protein